MIPAVHSCKCQKHQRVNFTYAYINCKIHRDRFPEPGRDSYSVKVLVDTASNANLISKSFLDKHGIKNTKPSKCVLERIPDAEGYIDCLDLVFSYKGKDAFVSGSDEELSDFVVVKEPKADLVLGLPWLWLRESKIDIRRGGMTIYGKFVRFCEDKTATYVTSEPQLTRPDRLRR
jgi:hypothetical protein